ncbi:MAG TPA: cell wall-binding repeat-containing protein [Desulfitobacterium dehalogenans]|uniref:Cell wall-binding repeat-containing protein n=1 Tax=Desulfitobacterium dehalogenans TaxID=36854 RepID=A0A7C7D7P4_9FIRM|nr:cell wall-binding repeat-containing protein [Desulfitobacterium dehalogenans]
MKKTKKALASLAIAGMVLSMAPASVFAADDFVRLAGSDRYQTSIKIAEKAYSDATTAVVAAGNPNNLVDALAAAPLAAQEDAPIYLTDKADMNDDVVKSMKALGVKKVVVVGAAASKAVVDELKAAGFEVDEVKGADRIATAKAINAKLTAPAGTFVVGYDGVADAMSVASYAAANNYAIVVANQSGTVDAGVKADYIVGGTTRVKDIAGAKRLAGADRYDTNKQVIAELDFDFGTVYVGNGLTLADALVGSVLAAQTDSPIALTDGKTVKADIASNLEKDSVLVALGGTSAVSNAVMDAVKNPPTTPSGEFKVDSVAAVAANAFKVKFGKAAADTEKVTFEVKNAGTAVTTTVNWNEAKTEASLVNSANYPQGNYTVTVKEGTKELGSFEVKIEQQKVAKIEVTSDVLSVNINTEANPLSKSTGYAVYKVYDQYGMDITTLPMANNIKWTAGIGDVDDAKSKNGLIVVNERADSTIPLLSYSSCVISGIDNNNYVNVNATLSVSQSTGTISKLTLKKLYSINDDEFSTSNEGQKWYIDYEALDASGNPTTSPELLKAGVLATNGAPYTKVAITEDPKDNKKAAIEVTLDATNIEYLNMDVPVTMTVILKNGQNATFNTTLSLGARPDSITLYSPAETVASGEEVVIPFVAYDQNGKEVTSYDKISKSVNVTVGDKKGVWRENSDRSASLVITAPELGTGENSRTIFVMATVEGSYKTSQLNITVQKEAVAETLTLDNAKLTQAMQEGAEQEVALGKALVVKDQYGRKIDVDNNADYEVVVKTAADGAVSLSHSQVLKKGNKTVDVKADKKGTQSVTFTLKGKSTRTNPAPGLEEKETRSYSFTVVDKDRITGYTLEELDTLYAVDQVAGNERLKEYIAEIEVFGTLSNGNKVVLAEKQADGKDTVLSATVGGKFKAGVKSGTVTTVSAIKLDTNVTTASAKVSVVVNGVDGKIYPLTADASSSSASPVVKSIEYKVKGETGATVKNDRVTITKTQLKSGYVAKFSSDDSVKSDSGFYFYGKDQYGTEGGKITIYLSNATAALGAKVDNNQLTFTGTGKGSVTLTAVAGSVYKTITLDIDLTK